MLNGGERTVIRLHKFLILKKLMIVYVYFSVFFKKHKLKINNRYNWARQAI